jgi:cysteine-rich repeat protein
MPVGASCDDGNPGTTGETCDAAGACTSCGNGVRSGSEVCDDGNTVTESSCPYGQASCTRCNATCTQVVHLTGPYCGDWATNGPEACDNGTANGQSSCSYGQRFCSVCNGNCTGTQIVTGPYCGDGVTNGNEACDDGNEVTETSCPNGEGSCTVCNGTCTAPVQIRNCPSMTVMWNQAQPAWHLNPATRGTYECSGNVPMTGNGGSVGVMTNSPEREGSAAFTCNNGTWTVVPGSSTCNGTLTITKGPLVCYDRDTARRVLIGWYLTDLHRCADPGGLDWWTAQYKGNNGCGPYVPGVSEYDHVRNDCIRNGFRSGAVLEYPNAGHITRLAEMNACDSRAYAWDSFGASAPYPYPPNHFVGMYCKALPNWR